MDNRLDRPLRSARPSIRGHPGGTPPESEFERRRHSISRRSVGRRPRASLRGRLTSRTGDGADRDAHPSAVPSVLLSAVLESRGRLERAPSHGNPAPAAKRRRACKKGGASFGGILPAGHPGAQTKPIARMSRPIPATQTNPIPGATEANFHANEPNPPRPSEPGRARLRFAMARPRGTGPGCPTTNRPRPDCQRAPDIIVNRQRLSNPAAGTNPLPSGAGISGLKRTLDHLIGGLPGRRARIIGSIGKPRWPSRRPNVRGEEVMTDRHPRHLLCLPSSCHPGSRLR